MDDSNQSSTSNESNNQPVGPSSSDTVSPPSNIPATNSQTQQPVDSQRDASQPKLTSSGPGTKTKLLKFAVLLLIIVAIAVVGVWFYKHQKANNKIAAGKQDIQLIRYGFNNNPLNAFWPNDASSSVLAVQSQIFEGLVAFQNGTQIKPQLASSWSNPNDTTWIFNLKPNIYYHDGDKVTAQDIVYTWQQINKNSPDYASYLTNTIKSVVALSNSKVEITTTQPDAILLNRLAQMYIIDSKAPAGTPAWELGTGAYTAKSGTKPTADNLDLVAFNRWHGGHIYTKAIDYIFYADTSKSVAALEAGKVNLIDELSLSDENTDLKNNYRVFTTPQTGTNIVYFDTTNSSYPTANIKVREAFNLAVDGQTVMNNSQQVGLPADQVVPSTIPGYNPAIQPPARNITEAASLIKAAGYPNGVTVNFGVGEPVVAIAQEIAKEVKPAGINLNIEVSNDEGQYFDNVNAGSYQAWIAEAYTSLLDGSDLLNLFSAESFYSNATLNNELNQAVGTFSASERLKELQQASLTLRQDYGYVPLFQVTDLNASDKGIVFPLNDYDTDLNAYFTNVYKQ